MNNEQKPWWRTQQGAITISTIILAVIAVLGYFNDVNMRTSDEPTQLSSQLRIEQSSKGHGSPKIITNQQPISTSNQSKIKQSTSGNKSPNLIVND